MSNDAATPPSSISMLSQIAQRFVEARRAGASLPDFPGQIPEDLVTAYHVQDIAISQWDDQVVGWKVGYIAAERRDGSGDDRLLGPIFSRKLLNATGGTTQFPIYQGGFGAVEAEYVLRLEADAPAEQTHISPDEAAQLPATLFIGVEIASSPLATINKLGPRVVISDFGNNNGLILGPEVTDWLARAESSLTADTLIDDQVVGTGGASTLPGGLRAAYAFALSRSAQRGRPLKRGDLIATGNATGIHDIEVGQRALIRSAGIGDISCTAVSATRADTVTRCLGGRQ
ncbi:2-keto-4-pentenoate hydratase [Xanthomonas populi]|uniref:2-keto-4-pentenoate hydratase n=1 Tax=Xanthomonas populi TaxID=53414 RepID=A0A2S7ED68_9XANT|nr:2-keto-4-pentenoate hydratase [Xanthomonas populi]PPU88084.1 2-keto-4-pentenoate hydratase [Xanthomonas populi]